MLETLTVSASQFAAAIRVILKLCVSNYLVKGAFLCLKYFYFYKNISLITGLCRCATGVGVEITFYLQTSWWNRAGAADRMKMLVSVSGVFLVNVSVWDQEDSFTSCFLLDLQQTCVSTGRQSQLQPPTNTHTHTQTKLCSHNLPHWEGL